MIFGPAAVDMDLPLFFCFPLTIKDPQLVVEHLSQTLPLPNSHLQGETSPKVYRMLVLCADTCSDRLEVAN